MYLVCYHNTLFYLIVKKENLQTNRTERQTDRQSDTEKPTCIIKPADGRTYKNDEPDKKT